MQSYSAKLCRGSRDPTNLLNFHRKRTPLYLSVANSLTPTLSVHISEEDDFVALQYLSHRVNINLTTGIQSLHSIYAKQASMSGYLSTLITSHPQSVSPEANPDCCQAVLSPGTSSPLNHLHHQHSPLGRQSSRQICYWVLLRWRQIQFHTVLINYWDRIGSIMN